MLEGDVVKRRARDEPLMCSVSHGNSPQVICLLAGREGSHAPSRARNAISTCGSRLCVNILAGVVGSWWCGGVDAGGWLFHVHSISMALHRIKMFCRDAQNDVQRSSFFLLQLLFLNLNEALFFFFFCSTFSFAPAVFLE